MNPCSAAAWSASSPVRRNSTPRPEVSLTTNGIGLARQAQALKDAGLDRVNVSLDTIRPDTFQSSSPAGTA